MGGKMELAAEIGSGVMIYIPVFIKIGLGIQKLKGRGNTQTAWWSHKPNFLSS
jgi:hypothetical protein